MAVITMPQSAPPNPPRPRLQVLVAEDGLVNRLLAVHLLEREGHVVTLVVNGQQAARALGEGHFNLVLMDVEMPVMDGLTATRAIRQQEQMTGMHTPIVALTSSANCAECRAAGMDAFLSKPLQIGALRAILDTVVSPAAA
jgi:two-component system sensor histidine kinase/response regulator